MLIHRRLSGESAHRKIELPPDTIYLYLIAMRILLYSSFFICLAASLPFFKGLEESNEKKLIKLGPQEYKIINENDKLSLKRRNVNFIDVTNHIPIEDAIEQGIVQNPKTPFLTRIFSFGSKQVSFLEKKIPVYNYPTAVDNFEEVTKIFKRIDTDRMFNNLSKFTSFYTRYYKSKTGLESADWLYETLSTIIQPLDNNAKITKFHHNGWDQYSIIVSIIGKLTDKVIAGAHQDSANLIFPNLMKAPGADDDGSGTVTLLESLRLIVEEYVAGRFVPKNTLEFHFYSAEEGGLLGSLDVFTSYSANNEVVLGMLQQDMTGYTASTVDAGIEPHVGLITDYTTVNLNNFLKLIIDSYLSITYHETSCGYACSDHSSALENGYPSGFVIESEFKYVSKYIHSAMDTIDRLDWNHIREHVKLTTAYAYELGLATNLH
ncbi:uncharacterized protein PRCAT00005139001 [Priceomyces carsonii]|uniref:uncharacterized protein n=1 Tax=Priceomyces carsonii TaxID=28549 RepID=UPI002EDA3DE5|nr:unnamed protein product [Priceomyces carsonii]